MSSKSIKIFACVGVPQFGGCVETTGQYFVTEFMYRYPNGTLNAIAYTAFL